MMSRGTSRKVFWGSLPWEAALVVGQLSARLSAPLHPCPQVFIEVILGIFFLSSRHIPGIL
jgi:hypothetical protein